MAVSCRWGVSALLLSVIGVGGCDTELYSARGGGWIVSADGEKKATFGFQLNCDLDPDEVWGSIQFIDHGEDDVKIHGTATGAFGVCTSAGDGMGLGAGIYTGTYREQPDKGAGGTFTVQVEDDGEVGQSSEDTFSIQLTDDDGVTWYQNTGVLGGGNISVF